MPPTAEELISELGDNVQKQFDRWTDHGIGPMKDEKIEEHQTLAQDLDEDGGDVARHTKAERLIKAGQHQKSLVSVWNPPESATSSGLHFPANGVKLLTAYA